MSVVIVGCPEEFNQVTIVAGIVEFGDFEIHTNPEVDENIFVCMKPSQRIVKLIQGHREIGERSECRDLFGEVEENLCLLLPRSNPAH